MQAKQAEEVLKYVAVRPEQRNGRDISAVYTANMLTSVVSAWKRQPVERRRFEQQGYKEFITLDGVLYPLEVLEQLHELHREHPECFE